MLRIRTPSQRQWGDLQSATPMIARCRDVRFGSFAAVHDSTTRMAAIERKADARYRFSGSCNLTGRFHQERSFKTLSNQQNDRPLSAISRHRVAHPSNAGRTCRTRSIEKCARIAAIRLRCQYSQPQTVPTSMLPRIVATIPMGVAASAAVSCGK